MCVCVHNTLLLFALEADPKGGGETSHPFQNPFTIISPRDTVAAMLMSKTILQASKTFVVAPLSVKNPVQTLVQVSIIELPAHTPPPQLLTGM